MGVRLYSPVVGRFLSVDPVDGGSASAYDYCGADPVNCTDLAGTWSFKSIMKVVAEVASVASIIPGPIGMAAAGVSAVAYAVTGDFANAALMTAGIALAAVGAGAVVVAVKAGKAVKTAVKAGTLISKASPKAERAFAAVKTVASKVKPALNRVSTIVKRSGCNSFEAGTLVLLADGTQIPIEDVAAGDVVMATDPITGVTSPEPVTDLIRHLEDHAWVSVTVVSDSGSEVLQATAEHPFFVTTAPTAFYPGQVAIAGGWVNAADLAVGDVVRTADGGSAVVAGVTVAPVTTDTLDWAFNLTVANAHTYYVGKQPVLVHNTKALCDFDPNTLGRDAARANGTHAQEIRAMGHYANLTVGRISTDVSLRLKPALRAKKIIEQGSRLNQKRFK